MVKDSGARREFEGGAVRDIQEGKGRCDLIPLDVVANYFAAMRLPLGQQRSASEIFSLLHMFAQTSEVAHLYKVIDIFNDLRGWHPSTCLIELSKHYEDGAKKYGEHNWEKGIPSHSYLDSAVRHYLKYLRGDEDEAHDRAFIWNVVGLIWNKLHRTDLQDLYAYNEFEVE